MSEPTTLEEYNAKFTANTQVFGFGADTGMTLPCPFCAEPDFLSYKIVEFRDGEMVNACEEAMLKGATCKHCGRGVRAIFMKDDRGLTRFEIVQTAGPDAPAYLPQMKRAQP